MRHGMQTHVPMSEDLYQCFYHGSKNLYESGQMTRDQFQDALLDDENLILFKHEKSLLNNCIRSTSL